MTQKNPIRVTCKNNEQRNNLIQQNDVIFSLSSHSLTSLIHLTVEY